MAKRVYTEEQKEKKRQYNKHRYFLKNDTIKEKQKEYRDKNKVYFAEYNKKYREMNIDSIRAKLKEYCRVNSARQVEKSRAWCFSFWLVEIYRVFAHRLTR